jgi:hypothetical protein
MIRSDEVIRAIDGLLTITGEVERKLADAGEVHAHEWMFALREILFDYRRILPPITDLPNSDDRQEITAGLREIAAALLYEACPHMETHLDDLLNSIDGVSSSDPSTRNSSGSENE